MHANADLTGLAVVALIALAGGLFMARLQQPAVVGYIVAGVALGPSGLQLISDRASVETLAELGVLTLLFLVGMELSLRGFRAIWKVAVAATVLQIGVAVGLTVLIGWMFGLAPELSVVVGFIIALSSTAVVVKMLEQLNILRQPVGALIIGVLIAQDLAVVPMLLTLDMIGPGGITILGVAKIFLSIGLLAVLIVYLSRRKRISLPFSAVVGDSHDLQPLAALAFCFGAAALTGLLELSPVLGAFLAGLVVGNSTARATMVRATRPIQGVLIGVFFLSIGLLIDLAFIWDNIGIVILFLILVTVIKTVLNIAILHFLREPWPHAFIAGVMLAQIGEFSLVISQQARSIGVIAPENAQLVIAVVALSLLFSPLWLHTARRLLRVILLSVTSLQGTLDAIRSKRFSAVLRGARLVRERLGSRRRWRRLQAWRRMRRRARAHRAARAQMAATEVAATEAAAGEGSPPAAAAGKEKSRA
jgi:CPA2 family monovalent cation:H+ antiporter-2